MKEQYIREVEIAFEVYEKLKEIDWRSWYRVIGIIEQLRNQEQQRHEGVLYLKRSPSKNIGDEMIFIKGYPRDTNARGSEK